MPKQKHHAPKGVKKANNKVPVAPEKTAKKVLPGLGKDAGNFLKERLGKKVKDLRCTASNFTAAAATAPATADLSALKDEAARRVGEFEHQTDAGDVDDDFEAGALNPHREAENTRKKFYVELRKVVAAADIIVEVLDTRDPLSCRNQELEKQVMSAGKKLVLLLNKIDLVPKNAVEAWKTYLQRSFPTVLFKAARHGAHRPVHAMTSAANAPEGLLRSTHGVVGADELMQLFKNYARIGDAKTKAHVSVGVVGYPNTGKSSVINSMKRHVAVQVGGRAGVTKIMQEIPIDKKVTLIDSPGVVFAGSSEDPAVVLRNVVSVESVFDPVGVVEALIQKTPRQALLQFYGVGRDFETPAEFLAHVAQARGKLRRGSGLDLPAAAKSVIADWTTGRFRYYVLPPDFTEAEAAAAEAETAEVVQSFAPALDIDAMMGGGDGGAQPAVLGAPVQASAGGGGDDAMDCDGGRDGGSASQVQVDMNAMMR
mmetsp:Transcript_94139/g.177003  ORF Transcript_94139/g.177003 Transcript_94139/m.177003 type:complete len:483 (-) Transcript_94139:25-1473(-)